MTVFFLKFARSPRELIIVFILVACCFASYSNSLRNEFMMDDDSLILQDPGMRNLQNFPRQFLSDSPAGSPGKPHVYYRPIQNILLMVYYAMFQADPFGYHVGNLVLYMACTIAFYFVLKVLLKDGLLSFLASLLFCVHPVNGMIVNYVTAVIFPVQILLLLAGFYSFHRACEKNIRIPTYILSLCCFVLALLCHETSMAFPFYLASLSFFLHKRSLKETLIRCLPFVIILIAYTIFRWQFASLKVGIIDKIPQFDITLTAYIATLSKLIFWYLSKLFFLKDIVLIYATPVVKTEGIFWLMGFIGLIAGLIWFLRKRDINAFALSWMAAGFIPVCLACLFQPNAGFMIEPHWLFFGSLGYFLFIANQFLKLKKLIPASIWVGALMIVVVANIFVSRQYNKIWSSEKSYCQYWLSIVPGFKSVSFYLASAYMKEHDFERARYYFIRSLAGSANDWEIYSNLGLMEFKQGRESAAEEYYRLALAYETNSAVTLNNLGVLALKQKDEKKALGYFKQALFINPKLLETRMNLAAIELQNNRLNEAVRYYEDNIRMDPRHKNSVIKLLETYFKAKEREKSLALGKRLLKESRDPDMLASAGGIFAENRLSHMALALWKKALKIDPLNKSAYVQWGKMLGNNEQFKEAIDVWQKVLLLDPTDRSIQELIAQAQELLLLQHPPK